MTIITADDKRRVVLPHCQPGDKFSLDVTPQGDRILRKIEPPKKTEPDVPLADVRRGKDGMLYIQLPPGVKVTPQKIAQIIREERDAR